MHWSQRVYLRYLGRKVFAEKKISPQTEKRLYGRIMAYRHMLRVGIGINSQRKMS